MRGGSSQASWLDAPESRMLARPRERSNQVNCGEVGAGRAACPPYLLLNESPAGHSERSEESLLGARFQ